VFDLFDKKNEDSFPIWYLQDKVKDFQLVVNKDLLKYTTTKELSIQISKDFQIKVIGVRVRELSAAQEKIINLIIHLTEMELKLKMIPYFAIDDYKNEFESATLSEFKIHIEDYYKSGKIGSLLVTERTLDEKVKIEYAEEL
ncbi:hypothetical protein LCGC14_2896900, partial [marine sediment metagenome]